MEAANNPHSNVEIVETESKNRILEVFYKTSTQGKF